jgi:hypothetical protein
MAEDAVDVGDIERAARSILAQGATSGAAMLRGFLAGLDLNQESPARLARNGAASR